mgnify:FL=1
MTEAATATGKTPRSIAAMFAPTTDITQFTDFIFRNDTTDEQRNDTINDRTLIKQFGFIGEDGRLDVISFPRNSTDGATATVVASLGDNPDHPQPVKFLRSVFRGYTVTVLPQEAVTLGHLPTSLSKPSETAGPDPADGSVVRPAGLDNIHYPFAEQAATDPKYDPAFTMLPIMYPIGPAAVFPVGVFIEDDLPTAFQPNNRFHQWYEGQRYLHLANGGNSLHTTDTTFAYGDIVDTGFRDSLLFKVNTVALDGLNTMSATYRLFNNRFAMDVQALGGQADQTPAATTKATNEDSNHPANLIDDRNLQQFQQLAMTLQSINPKSGATASKSDRDHEGEVKETTDRYQLFLASKQSVQDTVTGEHSEQMFYPNVTDDFLMVLNKSTTGNRVHTMQECWSNYTSDQLDSELMRDAFANIQEEHWDHPIVNSMCKARLDTKGPAQNPNNTKSYLGAYHFAEPRTKTMEYQKRQEGSQLIVRQNWVEDDKTKLNRSSPDMYFQGRMDCCRDIQSLNSNIWQWIKWIIAKAQSNEPLVWKKINELVRLFSSEKGKLWTTNHDFNLVAWHRIVMSIEDIWNAFAKIALHPVVRAAFRKGIDIDVSTYTQAETFSDAIIQKVRNIISGQDLAEFGHEPATLALFYPPSVIQRHAKKHASTTYASANIPSSAPNRQTAQPKGGQPSAPQATKKQKTGEDTGNKGQGMLKLLIKGRLPRSDIKLPHPATGVPTDVCGKHMFADASCHFGPRCNFIHVNSLSDCTTKASEFFAWVEGSNQCTWNGPRPAKPNAPASAPAQGTPTAPV